MPTSVGIRELRNRTSEIVDLARLEGEIIITSHGRPVAVIRPFQEAWKAEALRLLHSEHPSIDTGLADMLAEDDLISMDDVG
jgi:prevent-host-death family protein